MRLTRVRLRNYRVYEDLDLELPPGLIGVYGANGAGKCLPIGTRVWDADTGEGVPIEQFVAERRKSLLGFTNGVVRGVEVCDWHDLGERPTAVLKLSSGAEIELATTHPVLTDRGCVTVSELRPGDWVAEARSLPAVSPAYVSNDEALLLGLLLGDGCVTRTVTLSAKDPDVGALFKELVERVFPGCTAKRRGRSSTWGVSSTLSQVEQRERRADLALRLLRAGVPLELYFGHNTARFLRGDAGPSWETIDSIEADFGIDLWEDRSALHGGRSIAEWARSLGILGHDARTKRVPPSLLLLPDEQAAHLLAGLWLTDGHIGRTDRGRTPEVSYTSVSPGLISDVRILLLRLGITSTRGAKVVHGHPSQTVRVTAEGCWRFPQLPLVGWKADRAAQLGMLLESTPRLPRRDLIPPSFLAGVSTRSASGRERTRQQLSQHAMSRELFADYGGDPDVAAADTMWSNVVSVELTGRSAACFDVTVDTPEHLYIAETFVVHNSSLMEAIRFTLYGRARTANDEIRTSGVNADCIAEVEFEHEGHLYVVRRTISGLNSTVKAQAHADGLQVAEGVRDTARYVRSILGMDDAAFRASVFAEQKQIASFSGQTPAERRKLVLQLLGITPVDAAKDQARKDGRMAVAQFTRARDLLPDVEKAKADVADAEALAKAAAETEATVAKALGEAEQAHATARKTHDALLVTRNEYDRIVAEGKATKAEFERSEKRAKELEAELKGLADAADSLAKLEPDAAGLAQAEQRLAAVQVVDRARAALAELPATEAPARPDEEAFETARAQAERAGRELAEVEGRIKGASDELARANEMVHRASALSGEADCPLCGQALGDAFEQVQQHRADELARAEAATKELATQQKALARTAAAATKEAEREAKALKKAQEVWAAYEKVVERRATAEQALAEALKGLDPPPEPDEGRALAAEVDRRRKAQTQCEVLRDRLGRRAAVELELRTEQERVGELKGTLQTLREKVTALAFKPADLEAAAKKLELAESALTTARKDAQTAGIKAAESRTVAEHTAKRLADAVEQHAKIADLAEEARHLTRLGELLNVFRNNLVATVGPRLSAQAADLFAELTDHEYDLLEVDPESYDIQIHDAGRVYGMDRFSGSETDLANLALRVAISEHVRFQSGGTVGLLVLDEVFGPLDADRKERMLLALERLKARFRQVLVVTHDAEVKEQLPNAIEVIKLPGRRATARLIGV